MEAPGATTGDQLAAAAAASKPAAEAASGEAAAQQSEQPEPSPKPAPPLPLQPPRLHATAGALPSAHLACPTAFFLRRAPGTPLPMAAAGEEMEAALSWGLLPAGPSIASLHQLLAGVLLPWLAAHGGGSAAGGGEGTGSCSAAGAASASASAPLAGLAAAASKFCQQVEAASKQLGADVALPLPPGLDLLAAPPEALAADEAAVLACEHCVVEWARLVGATLAREAAAQPQGRGPLAELHHWQRRAAAYGSLHEQLGLPAAAAAIEVVARGSLDPGVLASFRAQVRGCRAAAQLVSEVEMSGQGVAA